MIPIALAFLVLMTLLVRQYGGHRFAVFIVLMVVFWLMTFAASVLIIGNQSPFFMLGPQVLPLDWFIIRRLPTLGRRANLVVSLLNLSTVGFYYCFLAFAVRLTRVSGLRLRRTSFLLAIVPTLIFITFDPLFVQLLSRVNATRTDGNFAPLGAIYRVLRDVSRGVLAGYLIAGIAILVRYSVNRPRNKRIQRSVNYLCFSTSLFAAVFAVSFLQSPQLITVPTLVDPFVRVGFYEISNPILYSRVFPYVQILAFIGLVFGIARFLRIMSADSFYDTRIRHGLRTASMGSRVIGHAVKNQLFAIEAKLNSLSLAVPENPEVLSADLRAMASMCRETYTAMGKAIEMLRVPRLRMERANVIQVVEAAARSWSTTYVDIDLVVASAEREVYAFLDATHFRETIFNLLNNARQSTLAAGRRRVAITIAVDSLWISVRIRDDGTGIDETDAEHLFDPFFTRNSSAANWGIGLTYCRSIVDAHGGAIEIGNVSPHGAQVELSIPRADKWR